jgi:hypothetical protein
MARGFGNKRHLIHLIDEKKEQAIIPRQNE